MHVDKHERIGKYNKFNLVLKEVREKVWKREY